MSSCISPEQFQRLVAERLSEAERETLEGHLAGCSPCQQALEHLLDEALGSTNDLQALPAGGPEAPPPPLEPFLRELQDNPPPAIEEGPVPADGDPGAVRFPGPPTARGRSAAWSPTTSWRNWGAARLGSSTRPTTSSWTAWSP
jgi:hypothetical protein